MGRRRGFICVTAVAMAMAGLPSVGGAAAPGNLSELQARAQVIGVSLTAGGDRPFPDAARIRARTGFGVSPNAYRCPARLGGLTFFRAPAGLGLTLLWRGPRHVSRVDIGRDGRIIGALRLPCRPPGGG